MQFLAEGLSHQFRQVLDRQVDLLPAGPAGHGAHALLACGDHHVRTGRLNCIKLHLGHFAREFRIDHLEVPASATANRKLSVLRKFDQLDIGNRFDHIAGFFKNTAVSAQITGVMIGNRLVDRFRGDLLALDQFVEQLGRMVKFCICFIKMFPSVVTGRTGKHNRFGTHLLHLFQIVCHKNLHFIRHTGAEQGKTAAPFLTPEDGEIHTSLFHNEGHIYRDLLDHGKKRRHATDKEDDFGVFFFKCVLRQILDQLLPFAPLLVVIVRYVVPLVECFGQTIRHLWVETLSNKTFPIAKDQFLCFHFGEAGSGAGATPQTGKNGFLDLRAQLKFPFDHQPGDRVSAPWSGRFLPFNFIYGTVWQTKPTLVAPGDLVIGQFAHLNNIHSDSLFHRVTLESKSTHKTAGTHDAFWIQLVLNPLHDRRIKPGFAPQRKIFF